MPSMEHSSLEPTSNAYQEGKVSKARELAGDRPLPKGEVKKPFGIRMKEAFVGEDAKSTALYFVTQVAAPRLGDAVIDILDSIFDAMKDSARVALFGEDAANRRGRLGNPSNASYVRNVNYTSYSKGHDTRSVRAKQRMQASVHDYRYCEFDSREEAIFVWDSLNEILDQHPYVCVNDFWSVQGHSDRSTSVGAEMGWTDLGAEARVIRSGQRYILDLPRARYLDLRGGYNGFAD